MNCVCVMALQWLLGLGHTSRVCLYVSVPPYTPVWGRCEGGHTGPVGWPAAAVLAVFLNGKASNCIGLYCLCEREGHDKCEVFKSENENSNPQSTTARVPSNIKTLPQEGNCTITTINACFLHLLNGTAPNSLCTCPIIGLILLWRCLFLCCTAPVMLRTWDLRPRP